MLYLRTISDWTRLPHPIVFSGANETLESAIFLIDLGNLVKYFHSFSLFQLLI